jgi:hypothetical protein
VPRNSRGKVFQGPQSTPKYTQVSLVFMLIILVFINQLTKHIIKDTTKHHQIKPKLFVKAGINILSIQKKFHYHRINIFAYKNYATIIFPLIE